MPVSARLLLVLVSALPAAAQKPRLTLDLALSETASFAPVLPRVAWLADNSLLTIVGESRSGEYVYRIDPRAADQRTHLFAAADMIRALRTGGATVDDENKLPSFTWCDAETIRVARNNGVWHWRIGDETASRRAPTPTHASASAFAAADAAAACIVEADLWVTDAEGGRRRITWDGAPGDIEYGGAAHRAEFGIGTGLIWGPGGRRLAFYREDLRPITPYPYIDYTVVPPKPAHGRYPMAGAEHSVVQVGIYDRADHCVRYLEHDSDADLYWTSITFSPSGAHVYVVLVDRGQSHAELVRFDAATGRRQQTVLREHDPEWIEPEHGPWFIPDSEDFLWRSPRDGYHHLYRYGFDGILHGPVTNGPFDIQYVAAVYADRVLVHASDEDARQMHVWEATLDGPALRRLTEGDGRHGVVASGDGELLLDRWSTLMSPGGLRVLDRQGKLVHDVATATSRLDQFAQPQESFFDVRLADGTLLHGQLTLPPDFDQNRRYPLLLYVYGGPHSQLVVDAWQKFGRRMLWLQALASTGVVIATVDNRGTDNRGIEFAQSVHRRLGVLEVEDQVHAVRQLCSLPFIDPDRVGVHGWSYGGYMTLALMLRAPDVFCCGVAGAPVTTWAQYETGYTERYMDTPIENPLGYVETSVLNELATLRGRLLVIHGSDDKTVMLSHAVAFLDAAIDAGVFVDQMLYPMQQHGIRDGDANHLYQLIDRYFREHLRVAEPARMPADAEAELPGRR